MYSILIIDDEPIVKTAFAKSANVGGTLMSDEEFEERKAERQAQEK